MNFIYESIVSCTLCTQGILRDSHTHIPRGFFTKALPGDPIEVMLVAQNPGQPSREENGFYANITPRQQVKKQLSLVHSCFYGKIGTRFHDRMLSWLKDLLRLPQEDVFYHAVYTNLVKCTTNGNEVPGSEVIDKCLQNHLLKEIGLWRPRVIVGLGRATSKELNRLDIDNKYLPHPSHRKNNSFHKPYLEDIRKELLGKVAVM